MKYAFSKFSIRTKSVVLGVVVALLCIGIYVFKNNAPDALVSNTTTIAATSTWNEVRTDQSEIVRAKVLGVLSDGMHLVPGTDTKVKVQSLKIEIIEGSYKGQITTVNNDHLNLQENDKFYLQISTYPDGQVTYAVSEPIRLVPIMWFTILFVVLVVIFGGMQGIRGLMSLLGSLLVIFYIFLPELLAGRSPILMSLLVSFLIIILGSYVTHGFNRTTSSAVVGMIITIVFTGLMAVYAVDATRLTGFGSDDVVYLNFNTQGRLDIPGLLLGGILIGLLGVLYDAAIGQAVAIEELMVHAPHLTRRKIFERAMRIGREHIGALIDSLALAYVGASLPLLLLFYSSSSASLLSIINREDFATEIIRTLIGSTGLILAVPITSLVAVFMIRKGSQPSGVHGHGHAGVFQNIEDPHD
jgi:uncharacterized membrane protein